MPRKKFQPKNKKGRYARRKPRYRRYRRYRSMPIGGDPLVKYTKLRWAHEFTLDAGSNSHATKTINMSSCRNPIDAVSTEGSPGGYTALADMYNRWTVLGAKISVTFTPVATDDLQDAVVPGFCGIYFARNTGEFATIAANGAAALFEQPRNNKMRRVVGSMLSNGTKITRKYSAKKFFGVTKTNLYANEDDYGGTKGADPQKSCLAEVYTFAIGGNNPGPMSLLVIVDYIVRWSDKETVRAN